MTKRKHNTTQLCPAWRDRAARLLASGDENPMRQEWLGHSRDCPDCRKWREDEARLQKLLAGLPLPGEARVAGMVMARIRERRAPLGKRDLAWWLAGSAAGVALGLWLAAVMPNTPNNATATAQNGATSGSSWFSDELDQFIGEFTDDG